MEFLKIGEICLILDCKCCIFDVCATKAEKLLKRKDPGGNSLCIERQQPIYRADTGQI